MELRKTGALLALALAAAAAAGCSASAGADKAGGPAGGPVVLRMASTSSNPPPPVADFIRRVRALSRGAVRIHVINQWGDYAPSDEAQAVHAVAAGTVDLGWAGSEVFDTGAGLRARAAAMRPGGLMIFDHPWCAESVSGAAP